MELILTTLFHKNLCAYCANFCAVLLFLFLPDQSGENENKHFTCGKIKNADEMRFINFLSVVLITTVMLTKLIVN